MKTSPTRISQRLKFSNSIKKWRRMLSLIRAAAPKHTVIWAVLLVAQGVLPGAIIYLTKLLVDHLVVAVNGGGETQLFRLSTLALSVAGLMVLGEILQGVTEWVRVAQSQLIQDHIKSLLHEKSASVDMILYDSSEYHDRLEQASSEGGNRPIAILENIGGFVQNGITLIVMLSLLVSYSVLLPLFLICCTAPAFFIILRFDRYYHKWWKRTTSDRRWMQYYDIMLTHKLAAAEMRLFNLSPAFQASYQKIRDRLRTEKLAQLRKQNIAKAGAGVGALVFVGIAMMWMGSRALRGFLSLGDLTLFFQAFSRGQAVMKSLLGNAGQIYKNSLYLDNLFEYLDLEATTKDPTDPLPAPQSLEKGIAFRNVTFRYPNCERAVLENFSLFIPAGKIVALVGANGAGKTTLLRLLCRFYDPEAGRIELDGVDIRKFAIKDLWRLITITFQMPLNYHATIRESIAMGNWESSPSLTEVQMAARNAGAQDFIERLPDGYETLLGKVHADGIELSGGEWQRIALARSYLRKAPLLLLDEPTSFTDSWSEADWFDRLRLMTNGRTALVITHRFSIAMRADIIFTIDQGRIVETGNHHDLLSNDGLYAQAWKSQMQAGNDPLMDSVYGEEPSQDSYLLQKV